ncbi:MAG: membrane protein insertase YidC [Candidatus Krumholzibacteria bacterium]|nr:membrane protein insertase YidC [Candidatus Krumholzibacteria bacterium]
MDKRSFLAIAVTFVILLAWQILYLGPRQKEVTARRSAAMVEKARADSIAATERRGDETRAEAAEGDTAGAADSTEGVGTNAAPPESADFFANDPGTREKIITVDTGRMIVSLTSRGAEISSVRLPGFEKPAGGAVELVPVGARGGMALAVEKDGEWKSFSETIFDLTINGRPATGGEEIVLSEGEPRAEILFSKRGGGGEAVDKRFVFSRDAGDAELTVAMERNGELARTAGYAVSWEPGLALNEKNEKQEKQKIASLGRVGDEYYKEDTGKFAKTGMFEHDGTVFWGAARSRYFISALIPGAQRSGTLVTTGDRAAGKTGYSLRYPFRGDPERVEESFRCYFGPQEMDALKGYGVGLEKAIDLGHMRFFSVPVLKMMTWMYRFIPNYGWIIIILSILTKVVFYRLTHKSLKSMKDMQKLQPKLKEIQEKYKNDKQKLNQETMRMYKESGVNPLGGCLPLLLQMPVFIALFNVLSNMVELRGAPFALWINDLSMPDALFDFGLNLPLLGSEFRLLPILMGAAMVVQSRMGGGDLPNAQTKMMQWMMPIVFTFVFYGMPSGLVLYWLVNNVLSIVQQYYVHKAIDAEEKAAGEAASPAE